MFIFRVQAPNIISKLDKKYTHFLGRDAQGGADFENPRLHGHADNDGVTRIENKLQNDEKQRHQWAEQSRDTEPKSQGRGTDDWIVIVLMVLFVRSDNFKRPFSFQQQNWGFVRT